MIDTPVGLMRLIVASHVVGILWYEPHHHPRPVLQRFGQVIRLDVCIAGQVGDCPPQLEDATISSRAQAGTLRSLLHRRPHEGAPRLVDRVELLEWGAHHIQMSMQASKPSAVGLLKVSTGFSVAVPSGENCLNDTANGTARTRALPARRRTASAPRCIKHAQMIRIWKAHYSTAQSFDRTCARPAGPKNGGSASRAGYIRLILEVGGLLVTLLSGSTRNERWPAGLTQMGRVDPWCSNLTSIGCCSGRRSRVPETSR